MKNACIVLKKGVSARLDCERPVFRALEKGGYVLDELRVLSQTDEEKIKKTLSGFHAEGYTVFMTAEKCALSTVKGCVSALFDESAQKNAFADACVYDDGKGVVVLVSADGTETGVGFLENACFPYLGKRFPKTHVSRVVRTVGANAERVMQMLAEIRRVGAGKIDVASQRFADEERTVLSTEREENIPLLDDSLRYLLEGLGDTVYALDDISLEETLVSTLKLRGKKISVAESFTGGGIARRITSVSGASNVYFEGLNTYDEKSKQKRLGVSDYAIKTLGAVSNQTAYEMATGLLKTGDCDISIATTGLAGPKSDRSMLPVGLCFIAVGTKERVYVYRYKFDGSRDEITEKAINYALFLACKQLKND